MTTHARGAEWVLQASPGDHSGRNPVQARSRAQSRETADMGCQGDIGPLTFGKMAFSFLICKMGVMIETLVRI